MSWRERNAPYGLRQLAQRLGVDVEQLLSRPDIIASAVGLMEGGRSGAAHVAESFMDFVERNGGGREGVLKAIPHYDTMVMANPRQIGNLQHAQSSTINSVNRDALRPTFEHLNAVKEGRTPRVLKEGYTKNFAAPYPGIPGGGRNYLMVQSPDGQSHRVPYWARDQVARGEFVRSPSGEYLVPEAGVKPFQVAWSRPQPVDPNAGPGGVRLASANPVRTMPEGAMGLGASNVQPPDIPTWTPPSQPPAEPPPPPVASATPQWNVEPGYFDSKDGTGEEQFRPREQMEAQPKIPPIDIRPQPKPDHWDNIQKQAEDAHGDRVRQEAVNNQAKLGNAGFFGNPGFQDAGSFFRALDGSGFKDGGAVKSSKDTAKYRGHPHRGDKCRDCTMFRAPHGCTSVRGAISPYGWCSYFEATPTAVAQAIAKAAGKVERNPTPLQAEFGNYSKGHFNWQGQEITIENPKGATRTGGPPDKRWSVKMPAVYGYLKRTVGSDGDHVDVYVGEDHGSDKVFVIDQVDATTGKFDEHKCMLSFPNQAVAVATYNRGFSDGKGPDRMGAVTELPVAKFLDWLKGDTTKPMGKIVRRRAEGGRVQDLDALSNGLEPISQKARENLMWRRHGAQAQNRMGKLMRWAGDKPDTELEQAKARSQEMDEGRLVNIGRTMQAIDGMVVQPAPQSDKVAPVNASLETARKYSRGR